jgi:hypothetical protein
MNSRLPLLAALLLPLATAGDRVVVVHPDTPVTNVSMAELRELFKTDKQHWADKTRVTLVLPKSKSKAHKFLLERVYNLDERGLARHWIQQIYRNKITSRPKQFPSTAVMLKVVGRKKGSIAIIDSDDLPKNHGLKVLSVGGHQPGEAGYPLAEKPPKEDRIALPKEAALRTSMAQDPESGEQDLEGRVEELEDHLADLQVDMLMGGAEGVDYSSGPALQLRGFGHVSLLADNVDARASGTDSRFVLGGLDLFITSRLSENMSFMTETLFEPTADGDYVLDVERVIIKYEPTDQMNLYAGRFHTTLGRWNELFHHGEYLQTSAGRPDVLNFEDENGLLPVHMIGVGLKGRVATEDVVVEYTVELGNGRGSNPDPPQTVVDQNDQKALNLALSLEPRALPGLRFGASYYSDKIPANADATKSPVHGAMNEAISNLFVEYERNDWHLLAEWFDIRHDSAADTASTGWYMELSRGFERWTPYVRLDGIGLDDQDLFFANVDDRQTVALGTRYELTEWTALRLQYSHADIDLAGGGGDDEDALLLQVVFAF